MYIIALFLLLAAAAALVILGVQRKRGLLVFGGAALGLATAALFWLMGFWGEMLWFYALEQGGRFWREISWTYGSVLAGGLLAGVVAAGLTWSFGGRWVLRGGAVGVSMIAGLMWGQENWRTVALYFNRVPTDLTEPILQRPVGFYLFVLPFYDAVQGLLLWVALVCLIASAAGVYVRLRKGSLQIFEPDRDRREPRASLSSLYLSAAAVLAVWAWGYYLARFHLLYSQWGAVSGPGWTDVYIRLPGYWIACVLTGLFALVTAIPALRDRLVARPIRQRLEQADLPAQAAPAATVGSAMVAALLVWLIVLAIVPGLMQWLRVEPNEITFERDFIANNIEFTRQGFALQDAEEREFAAREQLTRQTVDENRRMFDNIRLWDYRALAQVYSQFQEIRLYYEFADVDIDRYTIDGRYRQVMISARELELSNLPSGSQTFVNRHFKYTHGNGVTLTTVSDFTPEGLPDLLIKDIPPVSTVESLEVVQPRIYYGELTREYAVANSREEEFDYPRGRQNVYVHYAGSGGVRMSSFWRRLVFGWKLGGTRLLLSGYPTEESRVMFRRDIRRRVQRLAPFLQFDRDPYVVLADGRLYWILDAYTTSTRFPYSQPFRAGGLANGARAGEAAPPVGGLSHLRGVNYIRNSVKAVVDAYNGSVTFYVMQPDDPIIRTWGKVFPGLLRPREEMPDELFEHVRYPVDMLLAQGLVYAKYHMTDPEVFYNQEDLWVRATEKYYQSVQPVEPYYIMWAPPGADELEYILMLPFTPKNKQVLIGWIAGMCDGENYGRFLAYRFPKERRLLGPQQVETKIDQDPHLSGQLTLWDQRGSKVIRGNVLAIPIARTLMYVEPIYIQAETSAYPELRLVIVMHNDRLSYAETFDKALQGLFDQTAPTLPIEEQPTEERTTRQLIRRANRAFEDYLRLTGQKRFAEAAEAFARLQQALDRLSAKTEGPETPEPDATP